MLQEITVGLITAQSKLNICFLIPVHYSAFTGWCLREPCCLAFIFLCIKGELLIYYVLQDYERMNLADALVSKKFKDGECVIRQVKW